MDIPDPNLESAIREVLNLPDEISLTQPEMLRLTWLQALDSGITDLTGLEYATNLKKLELDHNPITDISPIAYLTHLWGFSFWGCEIIDLNPIQNLENLTFIILSNNNILDISPLSRLTGLTFLALDHNSISDFSPLTNLINLEKLDIRHNLGTDFTPLQNLNLTRFRYDEVCNIPPSLPSVRKRIDGRTFPSIFAAWGGVGWSPVINLSHLSDEEQLTLHDLHWSSPHFGLNWDLTEIAPTYGLATQFAGSLERAHEKHQLQIDQNPNMIFLLEIRIHNHSNLDAYPSDSDFWLRNSQNEIIRNDGGEYLINFLKPEVQNLLIKRMIAVERCGLYDGIMIDGLYLNGTGFVGRHLHPYSDEDIIQGILNIFRAVRAQVRNEFLIIINANDTKPTYYAEFVNGTFMETSKDQPNGYSHHRLQKIENTLSWAEGNLREPRINCLEGQGISIEPSDSPNNQRMMRAITALSLTYSDGYVLYTSAKGHIHH